MRANGWCPHGAALWCALGAVVAGPAWAAGMQTLLPAQRVAGSADGGPGEQTLLDVRAILPQADGSLWMADGGPRDADLLLRRLTPDGRLTTVARGAMSPPERVREGGRVLPNAQAGRFELPWRQRGQAQIGAMSVQGQFQTLVTLPVSQETRRSALDCQDGDVAADGQSGWWLLCAMDRSLTHVSPQGQLRHQELNAWGPAFERFGPRYVTTGPAGSLWLNAETEVRRVSPQGQILAQWRAPEGPKSDRASYGDPRERHRGAYPAADGGVFIVADWSQPRIVKLNAQAEQVAQWPVCSQPSDCDGLNQNTNTVHALTDDGRGGVWMSDGSRIRHFTPQQPHGPVVAGRNLACATLERPQDGSQPCFDDRYVAVAVEPQRYLFASRYDEQAHLFEMTLSKAEGRTQARFVLSGYTAETLPTAWRIKMADVLHQDLSFTRERGSAPGRRLESVRIDGIDLRPEAIRHIEAQLPDDAVDTWARLDANRLLLHTSRQDGYWMVDWARQQLADQPVRLPVNDAAGRPGDNWGAIWLGNDSRGRVLHFNRRTGQLSQITAALGVQRLAVMPVPTGNRRSPCGAHAEGVEMAEQDSTGRWWVVSPRGRVWVQDGQALRLLPQVPEQVLQLIPGLAGDMVAVMRAGVMRLALPQPWEGTATVVANLCTAGGAQ